jgi:hypothetical protein
MFNIRDPELERREIHNSVKEREPPILHSSPATCPIGSRSQTPSPKSLEDEADERWVLLQHDDEDEWEDV